MNTFKKWASTLALGVLIACEEAKEMNWKKLTIFLVAGFAGLAYILYKENQKSKQEIRRRIAELGKFDF